MYRIIFSHISIFHAKFVKDYFNENVRTALVPIILKSSIKFPFLKDAANYLIQLINKESSIIEKTFEPELIIRQSVQLLK